MSVLSPTDPTSRTNTVAPAPVRIGSASRSSIFETTELTGVMRVWPATLTLPDGTITLPEETAAITSSGDIPYARSRAGFTRITTVRWLPPNGGGDVRPGSVA